MLGMETRMLRIGELLSDAAVFAMPAFQRPYSWDPDIAAQLYDDVSSAMIRGQRQNRRGPNTSDYFLGPIIVTRDGNTQHFQVIDGQQRLVTLTIILAILRDLLAFGALKEELHRAIIRPSHNLMHLPEVPRVQLREGDQAQLLAWVQTMGATRTLPPDDADSSVRLLEVIKRLRTDIGEPRSDYIADLASFILLNCYIVEIVAQNTDDAYVLFRSLNGRGQPLNDLELAKAELLGRTPPPGIDIAGLARNWTEAENKLGPDALTDYLKTILALLIEYPQGRELRDLVREILSDQLKAHRFQQYLSAFLGHFVRLDEGLLDFGPDSDRINRLIECLRHCPTKYWQPAALMWLAVHPDPTRAGHVHWQFFRALDALSWGLCILGKTKGQIVSRFKKIVVRIGRDRRGALTSAGSELHLTEDEQAALRKLLTNRLSAKRKFVKPLLLRLNAEMLDPQIPVYFPDKVTIEHVLPQNPTNSWLHLYPNAQRRSILTELLGNYAILTRSINSSAKNFEFIRKRSVIFNLASGQSFPLTNDLGQYETWTEEDLLDRHHRLVERASRMLLLTPIIDWQEAAE